MVDKFLLQNRLFAIITAIVILAVLMTLLSIRKYFDAKTTHEISESALEIKKYECVV